MIVQFVALQLLFTHTALASTACSLKGGGVEHFKKTTLRQCFARCFNLEDNANEECLFTPATGNLAGQNCSGKFLPDWNSEKKVFCNFDTLFWSPLSNLEDLNSSNWIAESNFCTHIVIYPIVKFDASTNRLILMKDWIKKFTPHLIRFRAARLKILFTIGSWFDFLPSTISAVQYTNVANDKQFRKNFVTDLVSIMNTVEYLDGVNIRWMYPASPMNAPSGFPPDKVNYVILLKEISAQLRPIGKMLTSEGPCSRSTIARGINVRGIMPYLDAYFLMATDFHATSLEQTGLNVPNKEVREILQHWSKLVEDPSKLIVVIREAGTLFNLELKSSNGPAPLGAKVVTGKRSEICWIKLMRRIFSKNETQKWVITRGSIDTQSFASNGDKWISFDDMKDLKHRMEMVVNLGLGGVCIASALDDDIFNELGCGESPIMRTVNEMLRGFNECALPTCP